MNVSASRRANVQGLAAHLSTLFRHSYRFRKEPTSRQRYLNIVNFRYCNAYLTSLYVFIKFLYLFNVIGQVSSKAEIYKRLFISIDLKVFNFIHFPVMIKIRS